MKAERIIQGNKLIAEFIGIPVREYVNIKGEHIGLMITDEDGDLDHKYGIDWFWPHVQWHDLMPVVEKIEQQGYTFKICRRRAEVDKDGEHNPYPMILTKEPTKIESVWLAAVIFIENNITH